MRIVQLVFTLFFVFFCEYSIANERSHMPEGIQNKTFKVSIFYGNKPSLEAANVIAIAKVKQLAMTAAADALAKLPSVQYLNMNDGTASFSGVNIDALGLMLYNFTEPVCTNTRGEVTCQVYVDVRNQGDIAKKIIATLDREILLDRYIQLVRRIDGLMKQLTLLETSKKSYSIDRLYDAILLIVNELEGLRVYEDSLKDYDDKWKAPQKAAELLKKSLEKSPNAPLLLAGLAECLIQLQNPTQALDSIDKAIKLLPDVAYFYDIKGTALLQQNLPSLAFDSYERAINLKESSSLYKVHRGYASYVLGHEVEMCKDFYAACVGRNCSALAWSKEQGYCIRESNGSTSGNLLMEYSTVEKREPEPTKFENVQKLP